MVSIRVELLAQNQALAQPSAAFVEAPLPQLRAEHAGEPTSAQQSGFESHARARAAAAYASLRPVTDLALPSSVRPRLDVRA